MIRRPPRSTLSSSSAASDVYKRQACSWFPGNPVVKYCGSLHDRAFPWMEQDWKDADLVIVIGTSLGGLTADGIVEEVAHRSLQGRSLGAVCINLQQTPLDGMMTLRMFDKSDKTLSRLLPKLGMGRLPTRLPKWPTAAALVPYDAEGRRTEQGAPRMWLDLSDRAKIRITPGHNIQGAKQPNRMHIGASRAVTYKGETRQPCEGNGTVLRREQFYWLLTIEGVPMKLGLWWMDAAMRGAVDVLPIVNQQAQFEGNVAPPRRNARRTTRI
eukprot:TRINITY_DN7086_c0_g1_i1.p1 TRINITY_DN7086_c0_g1~~TRINITY_DN7086_c0_g1_i1.p1  ORF type:complete len:270 (-),score=48.04 TRINITY_DN7086_c0_g1_i1:380-1189(-)